MAGQNARNEPKVVRRERASTVALVQHRQQPQTHGEQTGGAVFIGGRVPAGWP